MNNSFEQQDQNLFISYVKGSRQLNNIFWAVCVTLGGLGFFLSGLSSFFQVNLLIFTNSKLISYLPQGLTLTFYGTVGTLVGIFLGLTVWWNVGFGYTKYDKLAKQITVYRKGFPGKYREIKLQFTFEEIKSVKMVIKDGLNPKRQLFLSLKDNREIPVTGPGLVLTLTQIENEAVKIAKFLNVFLETQQL